MAFCNHKEVFISGFITAYFLFVMMTFFEDAIGKWLAKFKRFIGVK